MSIRFNVSENDREVIASIADRASELARKYDARINRSEMVMDLIACHLNGCSLKLTDLLATDDGNFGHDVFGIRRHIDRKTGQLTDCFLPRFAVPETN